VRNAYTPTTNSYADRLLKCLSANPETEFTAARLAKETGIVARSINHALKPAMDAALVTILRRGHYNTTYQLKHALIQVPAGAPSMPTFSVALMSNGEMQILGASPIQNGVRLTATQAVSLRDYLLHTGSFISHLQQQGTPL
jgi:hypothetical protein